MTLFYGIGNLPWWGTLLVLLGFTHITIVCVTLFLHRCQAHRAMDLHPIVSHFFRFWLWLTTGMVTKEWTAVHRKHHAKCETPEDPHSPQIFGLPLVMWQGAELYRKEAADKETLIRYGQGTPDDKMEQFYENYSRCGVVLMLIGDLVFLGIPGLAVWAIQMAWIPFFAAGVVNGVGHYWGYRNFECPDQSTNIVPWGFLIGGEELHNNHHTYPTSAKFSVKWWEFDIGWFYLKVLTFFKLAKVKRVPPKPQLVSGKTHIDMETLKAIISNRFQIMARYSRDVIVPIFSQEKEHITKAQKVTKTLLVRESSLLDPAAKERLTELLENNKSIKVVYHFKEQLQHLWTKTTVKEKELLDALQQWCHEAEATGIIKLKEFVDYLKSFSLTLNVRMP